MPCNHSVLRAVQCYGQNQKFSRSKSHGRLDRPFFRRNQSSSRLPRQSLFVSMPARASLSTICLSRQTTLRFSQAGSCAPKALRTRRGLATAGHYKTPKPFNEPNVRPQRIQNAFNIADTRAAPLCSVIPGAREVDRCSERVATQDPCPSAYHPAWSRNQHPA